MEKNVGTTGTVRVFESLATDRWISPLSTTPKCAEYYRQILINPIARIESFYKRFVFFCDRTKTDGCQV